MTMTILDLAALAARAEDLHRDLGNTPCLLLDEPNLWSEPNLWRPTKHLYDALRDFLQVIAVRDAMRHQGCPPKRDLPHPRLIDPYSDEGIEISNLIARGFDRAAAAADPEEA